MFYNGRSSDVVIHALALLVIFVSLALPVYSASNSSDSELYLPINLREYEAVMGIQRRDEEHLGDMRPKPQVDLMYGRAGMNQHMRLAHMKLHASDGMDIVLMERFEHLTKSVDCHGQDGILSLTFKSKAAFNRALEAWSFINEAEEVKFLLITNHEDCSPSDQRRPYIITNIRDDLSTLTTFLAALEVPWGKVAGTFDLEFGKAVLPKKQVSRQILGRMEKGLYTAVNVRVGEPGSTVNLLPGGRSKYDRVDCVDCYVRGYFQIEGRFSAYSFVPTQVHLEVSPEGFHAAMSLEVTIDKPRGVEMLSNEKTIGDVPVPGAGFVIKDVMSVGLRVQFAAGFTTKLRSGITFRAGLEASLPWTSKLVLDALDFGKNAAIGFEGFKVYPILDVKSVSRTAEVALAARPKLVFGIDINNVAKFEISAIVNLPELKGTCTIKYKPGGGACPEDPDKLKTGVEIAAKVDVELDLQIDRVINGEKEDDPRWQQKLWSADGNFLKNCIAMDIPDLKTRKGKLVASTDLSGLGPFDDEEEADDSDTELDSTEEPDASLTPISETDIFSIGPDGPNAPETNSDLAQTDIFTPETNSVPSGPDESNLFAEEASSENNISLPEASLTTTTNPSPAQDFSDSFQSPTDPDLSPIPEFTTAPETSPAPEPVQELAGSKSLPESTPPTDDASSHDTQLAMDTFLSPEPGVAPASLDTSLFFDTDISSLFSSEGGSSSLLPERNPAPAGQDQGQLPPLGEGSNFDYNEFLPSETTAAASDPSDQSLLSFNSDEPGVDTPSSLSLGGSSSSLLPERNSPPEVPAQGQLPPLGEGSNFDYTEFLPSDETTTTAAAFDPTDPNLLSFNLDESSSSSLLSESNSAPQGLGQGQLPPLGEGSHFDYTEFLPSDETTTTTTVASDPTDSSLWFFNPDEPGIIQGRSAPPRDDWSDDMKWDFKFSDDGNPSVSFTDLMPPLTPVMRTGPIAPGIAVFVDETIAKPDKRSGADRFGRLGDYLV